MVKMFVEGRVVDPKFFTADNGRKGVNFTVAYDIKKKDGDRYVLQSMYMDCTEWEGKKGLPTLEKGQAVKVEGVPYPELYQTRSGEYRAKIKMNVHHTSLVSI